MLSLNQASAQAFDRGLWRELRRELQKSRVKWMLFMGEKKKRLTPQMLRYQAFRRMVPVVGLEPTRCRHRRILNPLRLPFHHTGTLSKSISHSRQNIKCFVAIFHIHCRLFLYSRQWISMRFDIVLYIEPRGVALAPIGFGFLRVPGAQLIVFENVVHEICGVLL